MTALYICTLKDIPEYPSVHMTTFNGKRLALSRTENKVFSVKQYCRHMGAPLIVNDTHTQLCPVHNFYNSCHDADPVYATKSGLVFYNKPPQFLDNFFTYDNFHEYGAFIMHGDFMAQQWLENTIDIGHVPHVHKNGFARVLDVANKDVLEPEYYENGLSVGYVRIFETALKGVRKRYGVEHDYFIHAAAAPNLSLTVFAGIFASIERIGNGAVHTRFFARNDITDARFLSYVMAQNRTILQEDSKMLGMLDKHSYRHGSLKTTDKRILHYRKANWIHV